MTPDPGYDDCVVENYLIKDPRDATAIQNYLRANPGGKTGIGGVKLFVSILLGTGPRKFRCESIERNDE